MNKIEVSMIVKNEEDVIKRCLESVKDADKITIIDTGSIDKTIDIAKEYTDNVFYGEEYEWKNDFAFHRNQSLDKCEKGNWILIIDADEVLEKNGIQKIRDFLKTIPENKKAVMFNTISLDIKNNVNKNIRLFKNTGEFKWLGVAHNYLNIPDDVKIDSNLTIYYGQSINHKRNPNRTFNILKKYVLENPDCTREKYYLAKEYYYRRDCKAALKLFDEYIKASDYIDEVADAYMISAYCFYNMGDFEGARECAIKAILCNADFKEPFVLMSKISGSPKNNKKWLEFSKLCNNEDVLFIREAKFVKKINSKK